MHSVKYQNPLLYLTTSVNSHLLILEMPGENASILLFSFILPDFIAQPGKKKISEIENLVEIRIIIVAI